MELRGNLILPDRMIRNGTLVVSGGVIEAVLPGSGAEERPLPYIAPGYIDIHNHGALGHDYMEAEEDVFRSVAAYLASHGVTSAQCTTVSAPVAQIRQVFDAYRHYQKQSKTDRCRYVGIHIEGPFISPAARGAHPENVLLTPEKDGWDWIAENADVVREITVAPELPGMPEMIRALVRQGITVSGGHDAAEPEDIEAAVAAGMTHCTHIYCAMSTLHKTNGHRRHGLCEYAMTHREISAEMIADGHHVPPLLAQMIYRAKGAEGVCVVSDAVAAAGLPPSEQLYRLGTGDGCTQVRVEDGVAMVADRSCYAGSVQALDQMVRGLVQSCGIPLWDAVRMASLTPAEVIGLQASCGSLEVGKRADLCVLDQNLNVIKTVVAGQTVYESEE